MVSSAIQKLLDFEISDNSDAYTDITELLFTKAQKLKNAVVVKSPSFNLFQGTHALEIGNDKLDSGLIELTQEEWGFDYVKGRPLKEVCWLGDSILRSVFTWLNNSSLSATLFSCRYVEELLVNFTKNPAGGITSARFTNEPVSIDSKEKKLIHQVLRSLILGTLYFVRLGVVFGQGGVVYEEEDINTQTMGLDVLSTVSPDDINTEIEKSVKFLQDNYADEKDSIILQNILYILKKLLGLADLMNIHVPITGLSTVNLSIISTLDIHAGIIKENLEYLNSLEPINGCYTLGIQKRLDNKSPSRDLVSFKDEDYSSLELLINDLNQIFMILQRKSIEDNTPFAKNFSNTPHHPFARAYFPLFFVRDDRSILGEEQFNDYVINEMNSFSTFESPLFDTDNAVLKGKILEFQNNISICYFEYLNSMNQNPCRQRQHLSRSISILDGLQAKSEQSEMNFKEVFQINDEFEEIPGSEVLTTGIPITSWVFYIKLEVMLEVVLRGFELDLYKPWEFHPMYWYSDYLIEHALALLKRVITYNKAKIERIKDMGKKVKKKKGDQKARYKAKYESKMENSIPILESIIRKLEINTVKYQIIQGLCHIQILNLEKLIAKGLIKTPDFPFVKDPSILYNLRMKPYSTVGVPAFPDYNYYSTELARGINSVSDLKTRIDSIRSSTNQKINTIIDGIESNNESVGYRLCKNDWISWFKAYQRSLIGMSLNLYKGQDSTSHKVTIQKSDFHRYFPVLKVVDK